jgi:putative ABC transport system permease protein
VRWHQKLILRIRSLFRKDAVDSELDSELQFHIDMQTRENIAQGMRAEEARYAARRSFGPVDQMKEECRDQRRVNLIETFAADVRHGLRLLAKNPGSTVTAVTTLALGIGTCTAIFSVVNAALLRPLPFADPDRVVLVWETRVKNNANAIPAAPGNFADWRVQAQALRTLAAIADTEMNMTSQGEPERVPSMSRRITSICWACGPCWAVVFARLRIFLARLQLLSSPTASGSVDLAATRP